MYIELPSKGLRTMATKKTAPKVEDQQKSSETATTESAKKSGTADHTETLQKLETLSEVLQDDLTSVAPDAATVMIDEWHHLVQKAKLPESQDIASGLKELQKLLKQDNTDGHDLGELLSHLGEQTSDVAAKADKELKTLLNNLGKQLVKVGKSLTKTESKQQLEALDELVEMLDEEADEIDSESATNEIDHWYGLLQKSEDEEFKAIASNLKELKQLLNGSKTKAADLSKKLIQLGEQTIEAADTAARGFKGAIKTLGKALSKLGESIE